MFSVTTVITEGIGRWTDGSRRVEVGELDPIAGFPVIGLTRPNEKGACDVVVDVADGQHLLTTVILDLSKIDEVPEACVYARQFAESAMKTRRGQLVIATS